MTTLNKAFVLSALFFSALFLWQLLSLFLGISSESHGDVGHDSMDHDDHGADQHEQYGSNHAVFTFVSVRSVVAFGTLFSWAGTLYLVSGVSAFFAIGFSLLWGLAAMFGVSYLLYRLLRLQETGTVNLSSAVGEEGTVYMNVPADGVGKVRVKVAGVVSFVNARSSDGSPLTAGSAVQVIGIVDRNTVEVESLESRGGA